MKIALYARVSKAGDQTEENQLIELKEWASRQRAMECVGPFIDRQSSRDTRPQKEEILRLIRNNEIDGVAFVRLDRWARSLQELANEIDEAARLDWKMYSLREGINLDTSMGRAMAQICGVFAELERELIRERTLAGLARAKAWGKAGGRHPKDCGCGYVSADGKRRHDGSVMPVRDASNRFLGWSNKPPVQDNPQYPLPPKEKAD